MGGRGGRGGQALPLSTGKGPAFGKKNTKFAQTDEKRVVQKIVLPPSLHGPMEGRGEFGGQWNMPIPVSLLPHKSFCGRESVLRPLAIPEICQSDPLPQANDLRNKGEEVGKTGTQEIHPFEGDRIRGVIRGKQGQGTQGK